MKKFIFAFSILATSMIFGWEWTYAAPKITYDVENAPQMYLDQSISATVTSFVIASPQRNGSNYAFATQTGGVLRIRAGSKVEDIYYASASIDSTTNKVTFSTVVRNLCTSTVETYVTCGDGFRFGRGSIVELNQDARLFNLKVNKDRANILKGSGSIRSNQTTQSHIFYNEVTTAQRDAFTYNGESGDSYIVANSTKTVMQYTMDNGASFIDFGSGAIVNATESVAGKVELGTTSEHETQTSTGSTGAATVVQTKNLSATGGSTFQWYVPIMNVNGVLDVSTGGTGTGSLTQSGLTIANAQNQFTTLQPGANNDVVTSDGDSWVSTAPPIIAVLTTTGSSTATGASNTTLVHIDQVYTIPANDCVTGVSYQIKATGNLNISAGSVIMNMRLGGTAISTADAVADLDKFVLTGIIVCRAAAGSSAGVNGGFGIIGNNGNSNGDSIETTNIATNAAKDISFTATFSDSSASHTFQFFSFSILKIAAP